MKNIAVIYKTKYGTTKQYAEWIADELNASLFEVSDIKPAQLRNYDAVIYGGGLYASGIIGANLVAKNPCKILVVFTVGLANPETTDYSSCLQKNFTQELLSNTKIFHLRGGVDYRKLGFLHKGMMAMLKNMVSKKDAAKLSDEDRGILETYGKKVDFTDRTTIAPLVEYVRSL